MTNRLIISLLIVLSILPLAVTSFGAISKAEIDNETIEEEIEIYRLRKIWLLSYEREIYPDSLTFLYQDREFELSLINSKLILTPGTQIFMDDLDYLAFREEDGLVFMEYEREEKHYEKVLGKSERLHFNDFLTDDELNDNSSDESLFPDEDGLDESD